ncbi:MAG: hypothetical protein VKO39_04390 [Cyanobacteriota bacterium]|nr:hypothetical protein [Cyanobacteriota bacterium]
MDVGSLSGVGVDHGPQGLVKQGGPATGARIWVRERLHSASGEAVWASGFLCRRRPVPRRSGRVQRRAGPHHQRLGTALHHAVTIEGSAGSRRFIAEFFVSG